MTETIALKCEFKPIKEEEELFYFYDGKEYCNESLALAKLFRDDVLFSNYREYGWNGKVEGKTTVVFVMCNDLFYWGTSDGEDLPYDEITNLLKMHLLDPAWGSSKWCCKKRNLQPQKPIKRDMIKSGHWEEWMDALPEPMPS